MKKTLFITMITAALAGSAYANTNYTDTPGPPYSVEVFEVSAPEGYEYLSNVYGGYESYGNANGNTVTMSGGCVRYRVYGGFVNDNGDATGNTVTMTGGEVGGNVYGGEAGWIGDATDNTVTMTGGEVGGDVLGGDVYDGHASGNAIHLVGEGASYTVGDTTYKGGNIAIQGSVHAGYVETGYAGAGVSSNNSVHAYGTGASIGGTIDSCQMLTFHLVDTQAGGAAAPMVTLGGALDLTGVDLGFYGDAVTDWAAFEGKSVTLVQAAEVVTGVEAGTEVDITDEVGETLATATLTLKNGNALVLNFSGVAPTGQTSYTANPGSPQTSAPDTIYGAYAETGDVTGGSAGVFEVETGGYESLGNVYGGYAKSGSVSGCTASMSGGKVNGSVRGGYVDDSGDATGDATGNAVDMTGGYVHYDVSGGYVRSGNVSGNTVTITGGEVGGLVVGGYATYGDVTGNTVTMTGGEVDSVSGGSVYGGNATDNTVTMTGGEVDSVSGGSVYGGNASGNAIHLVGEGASYTVGETTYQGSAIAIQGSVCAGYALASRVSSNNSVHAYGTGISIGGTIDSCQMLNFHIVQGQAGGGAAPMVTLGGNDSIGLDLTGVELGFYGDAVTDWAAFNGKSVTLVGMTNETITGLVTPTDPVDITDEAGNTVATATLTLSDDQTMLYLSDIQGVTPVPPPPPPVPTVGPDALDVALVNSLWASSAYVREFVRLSGAQGYALKAGDTAVWGGGFGAFMHATGNRGFKSDGGGYGIGVNHAFSANTQAGISFGQGFGSYHNSGADGAKVHQRAILAAATASTRIGKNLSLGGHLAFGNVRNRADCRLDGAAERARWNDNVFNLGAQAAYDFHVTEATAITPFLGLDWAYGAQESVNGAYGRHYSHGRLNELRMPVGVTVSTSAEVGSTKLLPQLSVAYVPSLAQQVPHANVSDNGQGYRVKGYAPGRNAFMLNVGVNAVFSDSWSAGASYTLETRSRSVDQSVNASVRYTF